jgi:hypothetical protein
MCFSRYSEKASLSEFGKIKVASINRTDDVWLVVIASKALNNMVL